MFALGSLRARRARLLIAALLVLAVHTVATTAIVLAVTSDPGPFTGCLTKGKVDRIEPGDSPLSPCKAGELQVSFSNAQGPQGEQGPPGVLGFYRRFAANSIQPGDAGNVLASCDINDVVTGTSVSRQQHLTTTVFSSFHPSATHNAYIAFWENSGSTAATYQLEVMCADLTP